MSSPIQVFIHVPKTGGTSFKRSCIDSNFKKSEIYNYLGLRKFAGASLEGIKFVDGHLPYGIHLATWRKCDYYTLLRDPLDQIVSYYYFIRQCNYDNYKHPKLEKVLKMSLIDFACINSNMQAKAISGFLFGRIQDADMLFRVAKRNLFERFKFYGFLSDFDGFLSEWTDIYGMPTKSIYEKTKITRSRPRVSDLSSSELSILKDLQSVDLRLYNEAQDRLLYSF